MEQPKEPKEQTEQNAQTAQKEQQGQQGQQSERPEQENRDKKPESRLTRALQLFVTFFKIGAFTFGGGYAMIPLIQRETVERRAWISDEDILEIVAIAESTPGPIAINAATFVGYRVAGVFGSLMSTLGVVLPSFILIALISLLLREFAGYRAVRYAFYGIRAGVMALIVRALWTMNKKCRKTPVAWAVIVLALVVSIFTDLSLIYVIITCALIGLVTSLYGIGNKKSE